MFRISSRFTGERYQLDSTNSKKVIIYCTVFADFMFVCLCVSLSVIFSYQNFSTKWTLDKHFHSLPCFGSVSKSIETYCVIWFVRDAATKTNFYLPDRKSNYIYIDRKNDTNAFYVFGMCQERAPSSTSTKMHSTANKTKPKKNVYQQYLFPNSVKS